MEKENSKKAGPDINEELMMSLMAEGVKKDGLRLPSEEPKAMVEPVQEKPAGKERSKLKRQIDADYESLFFKKTDTNARDGKTVYIQPDFHEKLSRIVQVIGEDKLTIYTYLNNVLEYHFLEFGEQITKSFNEKYKPIL
ncbi:DUF3408 domain-containing protein [Chryseobacterium sp. CKR4-1]|uniref:DUF3408 domain-containing protein n=1 Tax=Chryseobacterium sp. CKR4-1 TaxID=3068896 RepID=UPI002796A266|nr:DUF3408 domain-containing protein [Chryseobacterium sp. CKR4-1]MDQ1803075.1 DUF3408 domain-containing protein [Chryseobacterium sp. CKR4-1]